MSFLSGALSCLLLASVAVGQTPTLFNRAINGVTYATDQPVSPDSIASPFGGKLASSLAMDNTVPLSVNLTGTGRAILPLFPPMVSTVPANGDVNPYGIVVVPRSLLGSTTIQTGDILVSNFNSAQGGQGTGTTIVRFDQQGQQTLFYQGKGLGFTGALGILADGIVVAGSLPTTDGTPATIQPGSLLFIDPLGNLLMTLTQNAGINGPWGLTIHDFGGGVAQIFVSNVLNGTVIRLDVSYNGGGQIVQVLRTVTIAANFPHRTDPDALVLGPSGLAYDAQNDTLFVANSANNTIYGIQGAGGTMSMPGEGEVLFNDLTKLHGPVNMVLAPNGHLIVSNSDGSNQDPKQTSELVEFTEAGQFVGEYSIDPGSGASFGIAVTTLAPGVIRLNAVDDASNTMKTFVTVIQ